MCIYIYVNFVTYSCHICVETKSAFTSDPICLSAAMFEEFLSFPKRGKINKKTGGCFYCCLYEIKINI